MQFYSRDRIGVNMSRCVCISWIYKYRNIVPVWGEEIISLPWVWEDLGSGPWW